MFGCRLTSQSLFLALLLGACSGGGSPSGGSGTVTATAGDTQSFAGIGAAESVHFTGSDWSGAESGARLTYITPENARGVTIAVTRFAGRNGLSFSGDLDQAPFVMAVTPGTCSDGKSERTYPFTVTLQVRGAQREGCAWTNRQPFAGTRPT